MIDPGRMGNVRTPFDKALDEARAVLRQGRPEVGITLLERVLSTSPGHPDALQLLGIAAQMRGDHETAVYHFRRSLTADPAQPHVHNNLGNALSQRGLHAEALASYGEALRHAPDYLDARVNLGLAQINAGEPEKARSTIEGVVRRAPGSASAWSALLWARRAAGRMEEAIAAAQRSLAIRPGHVATMYGLALSLCDTHRPDEARVLLERCIAAEPGRREFLYLLGHALYELGQIEAAIAAYQIAVEVDPTFREGHVTLNRILWQHGRTDRFLASYKAAVQRQPQAVDLWADWAEQLNYIGRTADSVKLLEHALTRGLESPPLHHRLGQALGAVGRREEGVAQLRCAAAAEPERKDYRLDLVRALIVLERYGEVEEALAPVFAHEPYEQEAIAYLGLVQRLLGDPHEATLNDYGRFVQATVLEPPEGHGGVEAFNRRLEMVLAGLHTSSQHPLEQTLRNGTQTMGPLFAHDIPEINTVRRMIEAAVERYIANLPDDPDHMFLGRKRGEFRFAGSWSVRLRKQGFHVNHVHSAGWISSCYYVGLPRAVEESEDRQGWIKFGETNLGLGPRERVARFIKPEVGKLVLFPSYMYHGTVAFEEEAFRTTIAFDVVPAG